MSAVAINAKSFITDLAKLILIDFDSSEFLNIHSFNWYRALYSASNSTFQQLDFIRASWWFRAAPNADTNTNANADNICKAT